MDKSAPDEQERNPMMTEQERLKFFQDRDRAIDRTISRTYSEEYRAWLRSDRTTPAPHTWKAA